MRTGWGETPGKGKKGNEKRPPVVVIPVVGGKALIESKVQEGEELKSCK